MKFFKVKKANNAGYRIIEYGFKVSEKTFPNDYVFESHSESGSEELNKIYNSEQEILDLVEKRYNLTNIDWNKETYSNDEFIFYSSIFDVVAKHRQNSFGRDYLKTNDSKLPKHNFNPSKETFKAELKVVIRPLGKEIQSTIQQPNKPKPTTMLPDNMQWAWDPEAADWVAVLKDNANTTPPLYDPNNPNVTNQTTSYMSTVKSSCLSKFLDGPQYSKEIKIEAGLIKGGLVKYAGFDFNRGTKYAITTKGLETLRRASEAEHNEALNEREKLAYMFGFNTDKETTLDTTGKVIKSEEITDEQLEESWNKYYPLFIDDLNNLTITEENYSNIDPIAKQLKNVLNAIFNNSEIDKNLDINTYIYTTELFKDMVFENTKKGKSVLLQGNYKSARKWTICEADGTPLGKVTASNELDAKVKFGIEHPEYVDSQSICAKEIKAVNEPFESTMGFYTYEVLWQDNDDKEGEFIEPIQFKLCRDADIDEWSWQCEELFGKQYFYGFLRRQDAMDDVMKKLNKWGKIKGDIKQVDSLYTGKLKQLHSKYEETTETHEPYPNPSETPHDDIVLENHDGWVNTAEQKVTPEFAQLHSILGEYKKNGHILSITQDGKDLLVSCSPIASYEMKQKFEQLGYECEETDESETGNAYDLPSYTLRIKMK